MDKPHDLAIFTIWSVAARGAPPGLLNAADLPPARFALCRHFTKTVHLWDLSDLSLIRAKMAETIAVNGCQCCCFASQRRQAKQQHWLSDEEYPDEN
uniref:hypothetical protein n=1 Tax=Klebsiella sp. TaxID=576 RepID=UPI0031E0663E